MTIVAADARRVYAPPSKSYLSVTHARPSTIPSARVVTVPSFVVVVADDGWNEIVTTDGRVVEVNVTRIGGDATPRDTATVTFPDQSFRFQHDGPDVGKALISGVEMRDAVAGDVRGDDFVAGRSTPCAFNITIGPGEISSLDACGCAHCVRRPPTYAHPRGVCVDERAYESDDSVSLEEVVVVARDAGGLLMGSSLNALEPDRVVTVALVNYTLDTGERVDATNVEDSPLIADATSASCVDAKRSDAPGARRRARRASARSTSSTDSSRGAPTERNKNSPRVFARPRTRWLLRINARETSRISKTRAARHASSASSNLLAGTTGLGEDYYGVRHEPGFIGNASGLRFTRPRAGRYLLRFSSCRGDACLAQNAADALRDDYLEVTIRPGAPSRLDFDSSRLPLTHDVNVTFPPFTAVARDVSGNAIQSFRQARLRLRLRKPFHLVGDVVPIIDGVASFTEFAIIGRRGVPYVLTLRLANASIDASRAVTLFPCAVVKPNAASTASGACACHPGFTEDVSRANGTGHVPLDVSFSSFPSLYADVDPTIIDAFVRSLRPYGRVVPCAARVYKPPPARLRARDVLRTRTRTPVPTVFPRRIESPRAVRHFPGTSETSTRRRVDAPSPSTGLRITKSTPPRRRARRVHPARRAIPETSPPSLSIQVVGARTRVRYTSSRVHHRSRASVASAATRRARAAIEVPRADRARAGTPSSRNLVAWTRLYGVRSVGLHT